MRGSTEAVEFQMSFDRRTGKPVAVGVVRADPAAVSPEVLQEEKVQGTIVQEAKQPKHKNVSQKYFFQDKLSFFIITVVRCSS